MSPFRAEISRSTGLMRSSRSLRQSYGFLTPSWAKRLVRHYGTEARDILGGAQSAARDLGRDFGATLTEAELRWLMAGRNMRETAEDVIWRRTKLGLRLGRRPDRHGSRSFITGATCNALVTPPSSLTARYRRQRQKREENTDDPCPGHRSGHDVEPCDHL